MNFAYRWFCHLGLEGRVPDHSTFSVNRHGRFRDSDILRQVFESVVRRCMAAGLVGGLGIAPGANIGDQEAVFEAIHGTAPDIAGQKKANPTALLRSAILMLQHLNENDAATRIDKALRAVLSRGDCKTGDLGGKAGTFEFADAICSELKK